MIFKPILVDEACVEVQYLNNIGYKKGKSSGLNENEHHDTSKEGKKK